MARKDLQAYELEVHAKVQCPHCNKEFGRAALALHQCPRIPRQCDLCELTVPGDTFAAHRDECGNRTEQCVKCKKFLLRRVNSTQTSLLMDSPPVSQMHLRERIGQSTESLKLDRSLAQILKGEIREKS